MRLFGVDARLARKLDLDAFEHGKLRLRVQLGDELGVKVHVRGQGGDGDKRGVADAEQRGDPAKGRTIRVLYIKCHDCRSHYKAKV